jgi:hypothetical protein
MVGPLPPTTGACYEFQRCTNADGSREKLLTDVRINLVPARLLASVDNGLSVTPGNTSVWLARPNEL